MFSATCWQSWYGRLPSDWPNQGQKIQQTYPQHHCLRNICTIVRVRSVGVVPAGKCPLSLNPITSGARISIGLSSIAAYSFNTAYPPTHHTQAINHGRVRIGPHHAVGESQSNTILLASHHHLAQIFNIDLVNDARRRWDHTEIFKSLLAPAQKLIPFKITFKFHDRIAPGLNRACRKNRLAANDPPPGRPE